MFLAGWASGLTGWPRGGQTVGRTENFPILQGFVPYIGAAALLPLMKTREVELGKGTADHLMPLGYFLSVIGRYKNRQDSED